MKLSQKELEHEYDKTASDWLTAIKTGDELRVTVYDSVMKGLDKQLAPFEA